MRHLLPLSALGLSALVCSIASCSGGSEGEEDAPSAGGTTPSGGYAAVTGGVTGYTGGIPGLTGGVPGLTGGIPGLTGGAPGLTGGVPNSTGGLPTGGLSGSTGGRTSGTGGVVNSTGGFSGSTGGRFDPTGGVLNSTGGIVNSTGGVVNATGGTAGTGGNTSVPDELFSFFVTSLEGMVRLSGSRDGFGGDLRYGQADGLTGADKICTELAEASMPGAGAKQWRAFLSVAQGPDGNPVHAIDRVGDGPWYDRLGRVLAMDRDALLNNRPLGADPAIANDLPNEYGVPNHDPDGTGEVDNHHFLTGSNENGQLYGNDATCNDWTSTEQSAAGRPRAGFSWPRGNQGHWISAQDEGGCKAGIQLEQLGGSDPSVGTVGSGGGYGGIYCFALTP